MSRILLMCAHTFYPAVVRELRARGVEPAVLYFSEHPGLEGALRAEAPEAVLLPSFGLHRPDLLEGFRGQLAPAEMSDVEALAPFEAVTLHMMDRRNVSGKPVQELRYLYLTYVSFWSRMLRDHRIDAVVLHGTPHQGHDYVLYQLCRLRRIPTLMLDTTRLDNRLYVRRAIEDAPKPSPEELNALAASLTLPDAKTHPVSQEHYKVLNAALNDRRSIERELSWRGILASVLGPRALVSSHHRMQDSIHGLTQQRPRALTHRLQRARARLVIREAYGLYQALSRHPPQLADPYVYLPLHYQPERTTLPNAGRFAEQGYLVEVVAEALPKGWSLYVKEHPRQFRQGQMWWKTRSLEFYERLAALRGVKLVPIDSPTEPLIANARAVATATGTSAWEAVQAGTPGLLFGSAWYQHCPGVFRSTGVEATRQFLEDVARGGVRIDLKLVEAFKQALIERHTFRGAFSEVLLAKSGMTEDENGARLAEAIASAVHQSRTLAAAS